MKKLNIELYKKLFLIRCAEESIKIHYTNDLMKTPMHMSMGSEAIASGVCHALADDDQVLGTYRTHALYLSKTGETDRFFAEMYGKATGVVGGKGGSMHLVAPDKGLICTSAIVASNIPVGVGAAFANKIKKNGKMTVVFFGDGAIDEGVFWESINAACLMQIPIIFVCEDNDIAVHTPKSERHGYHSITEVISQFDCDVYIESSTDVEIIYNLAKKAIQSVQQKQRPAFLHLKYFRYLEHVGVFEDFNAGYREKKEEWYKKDPVKLQRKKLTQWIGETEIMEIEQDILKQVEQSVKAAESAPFPQAGNAYRGIYA